MKRLAEWVWGIPTLCLILSVGIVMTVVTRFVQVRKLGRSIRLVAASLHDSSHASFRATCTALAGTVGTGNIAGVAGAISLGGPGAVFWMWVSAFLGMAVKYAEVVLTMQTRRRGESGQWSGGPMYYIRESLGKLPAGWFALCTVLVSFAMGNMVQAQTVSSMMCQVIPQVPGALVALGTGLTAAILTLIVSDGGAQRLGLWMERFVPALAACYVFGALAVILAHGNRLGTVLVQILEGAFAPRAVLGGSAGIGIGQAIRWGVSRGVFSNEAGLGSAPIAHAASEASPETQGLFGVFEVFLDTIVLCTLTALAILVSDIPIPYGKAAGAELATAALECVFGTLAPVLMAGCLGLLALATIFAWQHYGAAAMTYLLGPQWQETYRIVFCVLVLVGATMELEAVWALSDLLNGLMCLPNLAALLVLRRQISPNYPAKQTASRLDFRG